MRVSCLHPILFRRQPPGTTCCRRVRSGDAPDLKTGSGEPHQPRWGSSRRRTRRGAWFRRGRRMAPAGRGCSPPPVKSGGGCPPPRAPVGSHSCPLRRARARARRPSRQRRLAPPRCPSRPRQPPPSSRLRHPRPPVRRPRGPGRGRRLPLVAGRVRGLPAVHCEPPRPRLPRAAHPGSARGGSRRPLRSPARNLEAGPSAALGWADRHAAADAEYRAALGSIEEEQRVVTTELLGFPWRQDAIEHFHQEEFVSLLLGSPPPGAGPAVPESARGLRGSVVLFRNAPTTSCWRRTGPSWGRLQHGFLVSSSLPLWPPRPNSRN